MLKASSHSKHFCVIRSLMISYFLTGILLLALAFLMYKCDITTKQVSLGIHASYMISCFIGGLLCGKACKTRRLLWGLVVGLSYFIVLFGISLIINHEVSSMGHFFLVLGLCSLGGVLGGIIS